MGAIKQKKNTIKLDLLYGIIIGINRNQGCTIKQLSSRAYWVKKKHLLALIKTAIEQGKINETSDGLYKVSWADNESSRKKRGITAEGCNCYACEHWRSLETEENENQ
ncbi:uncharacterized protein [Rhodnius prolixus]|uniref:H15 domain-containing protein n=1 Tax=Rhodnius prolixus TaxID=13249 RepID=T1HT85_RHOPR